MMLLPSAATLLLVIEVSVPLYFLYLLGYAIYNRYFHPLRHFPGPFWASITPLWYFRVVRNAQALKVQYPLHEKYGDFVRIAPNLIAVVNPAAIDTIYGPKNGKVWKKGGFYDGFDPHLPKSRTDSFSERDEARHAERRRIVAPLYTQGSVLQYEPCVDRVIDLFYQRMEMFSKLQEPIDMGEWLRRYTFDVIGEIYYGRKGGFGMVRDGIDYKNWLLLMDTMPNIGASITYFPYGFRTLYMMSQMVFPRARTGVKGMMTVGKQAMKAVEEQWKDMQAGLPYPKNTMLSNMLEIVRDSGEKKRWGVGDVATEAWAVIWAGSDTTATALASLLFRLLRNPDKLHILRQEIDEAFDEGRLTYPVRFNDARKLPYLHAVVLESMRIHGSLGTGLPRQVPAEGADICGTWLPGNVEVVMNSNSCQFDPRAFGADSKEWIPERWLRNGEEAAAKMERSLLQFGYGPRICIGRHITSIEMYKVLPTILRDFDFELLVDKYSVNEGWFHMISDLTCKVKKRRPEQQRPNLVLEHMR